MPQNMKISTFFQDFNYGWSETWFLTFNNAPLTEAGYSAAFAWATGYGKLRLKLCGVTSQLTGFRVSDDAILRDSRVQTVLNQGDGVTGVGGPPPGSERIYSVLRMRCDMGPTARSVRSIRGFPLHMSQNPDLGFARFPAPFKQAWDDLVRYLLARDVFDVPLIGAQPVQLKRWQVALAGVPPVPVAPVPITAWVATADPRIVQFTGASVPPLGARVRIAGVLPRYLGLNGDYTIRVPVDLAGVGILFNKVFNNALITSKGQWTLLAPTYPAVDKIGYDGESSRKAGRPSASPRGRSRVRFRT